LRVLFPFVGDSIGGAHRSIIELHSEIENTDITPIIVLHEIGPLSDLLDSLNLEYEHIFIKNLAGESPNILKIATSILLNFFKISKFIRKNKIDIVHGNDLRINLTWSLPTRLSSKLYIWHQRSLMTPSVLWKSSVLLANHFISISDYVHHSIPSNIPKSKKTLILNPFNLSDIYEKSASRKWLNELFDIPENSILLGYIGRLIDWKNVDFLIKCFEEFNSKRDINFHLLIVGSGNNEYVKYLKKLSLQLGINDSISFAGFSAESNRIISSFDLLIAPSNEEPFGRTLVEAMIQKTPVLAARGGGHSEIIEDEVTGLLYEHNNINNFVTQCDKFINNTKFLNSIINKASEDVNLKYSSRKHAQSIIKIYHKLTRKNQG
jgi:glycosyltransferase involved in cell wall biosynthesis